MPVTWLKLTVAEPTLNSASPLEIVTELTTPLWAVELSVVVYVTVLPRRLEDNMV